MATMGKPYVCPYCHSRLQLVDSSRVYNKSYGKIWICSRYPECDAYVGCHKGTNIPLGQPANAELRGWRVAAHDAFDRLWKSPTRRMSRNNAYVIMQKMLRLGKDEAHIAQFNERQCRQLVLSLQHKYPELYEEEDVFPDNKQEY